MHGYNYASEGAYFVTICTHHHACLFGEIVNGEMQLNDIGTIINEEWRNTERIRLNVELDAFVVMPNHVHGVIILNNIGRGTSQRVPMIQHVGATRRVAPTKTTSLNTLRAGSIGAIIGQFKSISTKRINSLRKMFGFSLWQRGYYEHIIRDDEDFDRIREYIESNPASWQQDKENPKNMKWTNGI